jgi:hypothetical protein
MAARMKRKRAKAQRPYLNENSVLSDVSLEPIVFPEIRVNLGLPMGKVEYSDGSFWYPLASESWVTANAGTVKSITAGTGLTGGTISSIGTISLASVGINAGTYAWPSAFSVNSTGQLTDVTITGSLPINRLSGYPGMSSVFLRGDGVWSSTSSSTIDINTDTTGQLNISRLKGYPSSSNAFLRGDGTWILPYINNLNINGTASFSSYGLTTSGTITANAISASGGSVITFNHRPLISTGQADQMIIINNLFSQSLVMDSLNSSSFKNDIDFRLSGSSKAACGFNNNTNEGYLWTYDPSSLKFGTDSTKRIDIAGNSAKTTFYEGLYQCYIHPSSKYLDLRAANVYNSVKSTIFESNASGKTSSLVMNGYYMQFINPLYTLGFIFTDADNSTMTSYVAYINGSGQFISSSKEQKHSLQRKEHKDYLDRLNRLNVYSYGLKYDILEDDSPQKKERKARKANELQVGLIAEEVRDLFDNATNIYKPLDEKQQTNHPHTPSLAINYNKLLCYTILAIQELTNRVNFLEKNDLKSLS